jgi:hypothetical protein
MLCTGLFPFAQIKDVEQDQKLLALRQELDENKV